MNFDFYSDALLYAIKKHNGQLRKYTNEPYITHCIAVAATVARFGGDPAMVKAALLHDVLEDTDATYDELGHAVGPIVAKYVLLLTDCGKEVGNRKTRKEVDRARLAAAPGQVQTIKLADLIDNTESIVEHDPDFAKVYLVEKRALVNALTDAHPIMRDVALQVVTRAERRLAAMAH
jgi:(p)ppGpp synthase/HD superfamily hydrolase